MNRISLKDMKFYGYTGCLPEEKEKGQWFYISIDLFCKTIRGTISDELNDTVNYADVFDIARKLVEGSKFNLIEHMAYEIGRAVISAYEIIDEIEVTVRKPDAPIDGEFEAMETKIELKRRDAVIGFGGNMGDREQIIRKAVGMVADIPGVKIRKISSLYETEPVGYDDQADFLNGCMAISTYLEPFELLSKLQKIELDLDRVRTIKNGPRTIDLDLLLMSGVRLDTEELTIPHPRMYERAFVLVPLKEIGYYHGDIPQGKDVRLYGIMHFD